MNKILPIILVVLFSSNVFADEQKYIDEAQEQSETVFVAKIILSSGKSGYHLYANVPIRARLESKAGMLCNKGYIVHREETYGGFQHRKWVIECK